MALSSIDRFFLRQSLAAKKESQDPDRQVGVAIASEDGRLLAVAANRPPHPIELSAGESRAAITRDPQWKYFVFEHAERNAINDARAKGHSLDGATLYSTLFPCADCARAIVAAGIKRLVVPQRRDYMGRDEKWRAHYVYAEEIFRLSGTKVDLVEWGEVASGEEICRLNCDVDHPFEHS